LPLFVRSRRAVPEHRDLLDLDELIRVPQEGNADVGARRAAEM